jgi:hypothetical protein
MAHTFFPGLTLSCGLSLASGPNSLREIRSIGIGLRGIPEAVAVPNLYFAKEKKK